MLLCKHFSAHVKKRRFLILHSNVLTCTHGEVRHFGRLPEVRNSLPVNLVQKVSKSVSICKSYCKTFTGTFLWTTTTTLLYQRMQKNYTTCYHAGNNLLSI